MSQDKAQQLEASLARIPYAQFLGLRALLSGDELTLVLPFSNHLIGNPNLPAIHGGVLGALMEITAIAELALAEGLSRQPRPIDVAIDYLRSGRPVDTFARAEIKRLGRRVANVRVETWQEARGRPIASLHGHFLVTPASGG